MRIAIVTGFSGFASSYSLCSVVLDQVDGLTQLGHGVEVWNMANCEPNVPRRYAGVMRAVIPVHETHHDHPDHGKIEDIACAVEHNLRRFQPDVIIAHDIVFQTGGKTMCEGVSIARERWSTKPAVHFIHSATVDEGERWGRRGVFAGDRIIYSDASNIDVIARGYGIPEGNVHPIHASRDIGLAGYITDDVLRLIRRHRLHERDIVQVFPACHTRLESKGLRDAIAVFECLKAKNKSVALVVCDAHATGGDTSKYASDVLGDDLIFTSDAGVDRWVADGLRTRELVNLRSVANLFIWPSRAETSSLAVKEAMLAGELLVLNSSVPASRENARNDAIYAAWPEHRTNGGQVNGVTLADQIIARLEACPINRNRRRALREFSAETHARRILEVIRETT